MFAGCVMGGSVPLPWERLVWSLLRARRPLWSIHRPWRHCSRKSRPHVARSGQACRAPCDCWPARRVAVSGGFSPSRVPSLRCLRFYMKKHGSGEASQPLRPTRTCPLGSGSAGATMRVPLRPRALPASSSPQRFKGFESTGTRIVAPAEPNGHVRVGWRGCDASPDPCFFI